MDFSYLSICSDAAIRPINIEGESYLDPIKRSKPSQLAGLSKEMNGEFRR
jgi:hypothetical protein